MMSVKQLNGKFIVLGEVNIVVTALRRTSRWTGHNYQSDHEDALISTFNSLKNTLNRCDDLNELEPVNFLNPFLEVIRSEDTSGPITGLALSSINKFLSYALIDSKSSDVASAIASMADAVTHARFVGTDPANDEVVLMKILQVLRVLLLTDVGIFLTNEAVCEIMQSCFRICFEMRLSELLRKSAEHTLIDMVQLLFGRMPQFKEDLKDISMSSMKKLKMRAGGMGDTGSRAKRQKKSHRSKRSDHRKNLATQPTQIAPETTQTKEADLNGSIVVPMEQPSSPRVLENDATRSVNEEIEGSKIENEKKSEDAKVDENDEGDMADSEGNGGKEDEVSLVRSQDSLIEADECDEQSQISDTLSIQEGEPGNPRGVKFTSSPQQDERSDPLVPYNLLCIRELFRFLISLTNPHDRHNTDVMMHMGMSLLMVTLEVSRYNIVKYPSLLQLVKDDLCRYLFQLLNVDRLNLIASSLRLSLLVFESLRHELKFQLEQFLKKLMELIGSSSAKLPYEVKELSIEAIVQLWHIPGFVTELYLNYDCDYYCSNVFEDISKLLAKNAFPVAGLYTTHLLSLEALLTVVRSVEMRCSLLEDAQEKTEYPSEDQQPATPPGSPLLAEDSTSPPLSSDQVAAELEHTLAIEAPDPKVPSRFSGLTPSVEELKAIRQKKKIIQSGTELFNQKSKKGITYLQEQNLLALPLDAREVSRWLRENPWLDKKMIGEFISDRRHPEILDNFVRTFKFEGLRIDESLRMYLETFRLPGEAPVIQRLIEAFSGYWSESNHHPFMNLDAAFTLSYAVIMLNTDQHNRNVRKQNEPMNLHDFKRNVKGCNGGVDFDQHMLEELFVTIKNDEIVLPDEQTGPIRDRWLWNVFLRRGATTEGLWLHSPPGRGAVLGLHLYDREIFAMIWGPTVSALSYVFDKSHEELIIQKAITGYRKCARISAHFAMSNVFDNLMVSLCKFTALAGTGESPELTAISFGSNAKAQLAARTAFALAHRHGDILREGWRNIFDIILPLYRAKLLSTQMVEVEDFVDPTGRISLIREELPMQRSDSSIFSSLYQFMTGPVDTTSQKQAPPEDAEANKTAQNCVKDLQLETLVTESKFLRLESLQEMVKALIQASHASHTCESLGVVYCEDSSIFFLELLLRVVLQNRDRIVSLWQLVRDHLYTIIVMATDYSLHLERAVVGLMRMAIRLLHREDVAEEILASLQILLMIKPTVIPKVGRQISFGFYELLRTNAANIHSREDWITIFTVMKCVGAGAVPPPILQVPSPTDATRVPSDEAIMMEDDGSTCERKTQSDSETTSLHGSVASTTTADRGYTSDSELYDPHTLDGAVGIDKQKLQNRTDERPPTIQMISTAPSPSNQFSLQLGEELHQHDMRCMVKSCETLAFLIRDAAHVTPDNFELCVRCIRTFVEASINGLNRVHHAHDTLLQPLHKQATDKKKLRKRKERDIKRKGNDGQASARHQHGSDEESSMEVVPGGYHTLSLQLLDLMHTLHTRAASIYGSWAEEEKRRTEDGCQPPVSAEASSLWDKCWCPLLQGIARLCCDARRQVRTSALTYLQRALLVHDLQTLTGKEWEACFNKVLFPLLTKLLENISPADPDGMEETRMRGATLLSKVFLQHLNPLLTLPTFTALWLTILDFMDKYMHIGSRDLLFEAIPESLKNMLLVMDTAGIFHSQDTETGYTSLWTVTWERIDCFLPNLKAEVFKPPSPDITKPVLVAPHSPELPREAVPKPQNMPFTPKNVISPLAGSPPIRLAGVIAAPMPKVSPPSSLNAQSPNLSLSPPFLPHGSPVSLVNPPPSSVPSNISLRPPHLIGLGDATLPSLSPQTPTSNNILMTPSLHVFNAPHIVHLPVLQAPPTKERSLSPTLDDDVDPA